MRAACQRALQSARIASSLRKRLRTAGLPLNAGKPDKSKRYRRYGVSDMWNALETGSGAWVALLGWPAIGAAVAVMVLATLKRSHILSTLGCVLALPLFLYLALTPHFRWLAVAAYLLLVVHAWRLDRAHPLASVLLVLPAASLVAWLGWAVLTQ